MATPSSEIPSATTQRPAGLRDLMEREDQVLSDSTTPQRLPGLRDAAGGLRQQEPQTPLSRFIDFTKRAAEGVGGQPLFPEGTPGSELIGETLGEGAESVKDLIEATVVEPLGDVVAAGSLYLDMADMLTKAIGSVFMPGPENRPPNPIEALLSDSIDISEFPETIVENARQAILAQPEDLPTEEKVERARRGFALVGGAIVAGGTNTWLKSIGGRVSALGPVQAAGRMILSKSDRILPALGRIGAATSTGFLEGEAFGSTYGALEPLSDEDLNRWENIKHKGFTFGLFNSAFRGLGAVRGERLRGTPLSNTEKVAAEQAEGLIDASSEALVFMNRERSVRPMPPQPMNGEELVAQVVAGSTKQGASKLGFEAVEQETIFTAMRDLFLERFPKVKALDPSTDFLAKKFVTSRISGAAKADMMYEYVSQGLTAEQESLLVRGLIASRGRAIRDGAKQRIEQALAKGDIEAARKAQADLSNVRLGEMPPADRLAFKNDPKIQEAVARYDKAVSPQLLSIRTRNGLRTIQDTDLPFVRLIRATQKDMERGIETLQSLVPTGEGGRVAGAATRATRTTPGAQRATGSAPAYIADLKTILRRTFAEEISIDRRNELVANIITAPWSRKLSKGQNAPKAIEVGEKEIPMEVIEINGNPRVLTDRFGILGLETEQAAASRAALENPIDRLAASIPERRPERLLPPPSEAGTSLLEGTVETVGTEGFGGIPGEVGKNVLGRYAVPKPVADMFKEIIGEERTIGGRIAQRIDENILLDGIARFVDFNTGLLLTGPAEMTFHGSRIVAELSRQPGLGQDIVTQMLGRAIPFFGPKLAAMREIWNPFRTEAGVQMHKRLLDVPGGTTGRFLQLEFDRGVGALIRKTAGKEASEAAEFGRRFLFDQPELGPGLAGFDQRARVAAAVAADKMIKRELGREITDAELEIFLRQFGQYTNEVNGVITDVLRKSRIAPFMSGQVGMIPGEIKGFFGGTNLPKSTVKQFSKKAQARIRAEILYRGTVGTALTMTTLNRLFTGKWIWENEKGHRTDLALPAVTEDGRQIYLDFTSLEPAISRAARIVGARTLVETFGGDGGASDVIGGALNTLANAPITYGVAANPGTSAAFTFATGRAPYLLDGGDLLRVVPPQPTMPLMFKERAIEGLLSSNPATEAFFGELAELEEQPIIVRSVNALGANVSVGSEPIAAISADLRAKRAEQNEVIQDRVSRAIDMDSRQEALEFLKEEAKKFPVPEREQRRIFIEMRDGLIGRKVGRGRSAREATIRKRQRENR